MTKLALETTKVVGTSTPDSWSQTHYFVPEDKEKKKTRGELLAVLAVEGLGDGIEAVAFGREVINRLHEEYYGKPEEAVPEGLKGALEKIGHEFGAKVRVEITAAVFVEDRLYVGTVGNGRVLFVRDGQIGEILRGGSQVMTASGYLAAGDQFLIGTEDFFRLTADGVLRAALFANSPEETGETLAAVVHGQVESGAAAALVARVKETDGQQTLQPEPGRSVGVEAIISDIRPGQMVGGGKIKRRARQVWARVMGNKEGWGRLPGGSIENWLRLRLGKGRSARSMATTVAILVVILIVSVGFGTGQRRRQNEQSQVEVIVAAVRPKTAEAEALLELNPARTRELVAEAEGLLNQADPEVRTAVELTVLVEDVKRLKDLVVREKQAEVKDFFDLGLIKKGAEGDDLTVSGEKFYVLDRNLATVYEVDIATKKMAIVGGGKALEKAREVAAFLPQVWVLTDKDVLSYNRQTGREAVAVESGGDEAVDAEAFASSLYALESDGIWQYPAAESGLGSRRNWLKGEAGFDFANARALAIDGSVWVVNAGGQIARFNRGRPEAFGTAGMDYTFGEVVDLFTDENQKGLYLLDNKGAVVAVDKSGEYRAAYVSDRLAGATDLVVSEEAGKAWVLKGSEILEIGLATN